MQSNMILIWTGVMLVIAGIVLTAAKALGPGRLSEPRLKRQPSPSPTLEPPTRTTGLQLTRIWPGLAVAGLGTVLLLAAAAF